MKKKLAILLAAVMVAAMVPVSAFATSTNYLTGQAITVNKDTTIAVADTVDLAIEDNKMDISNYYMAGKEAIFELNLSNATWSASMVSLYLSGPTFIDKTTDSSLTVKLSDTTIVGSDVTAYWADLAAVAALINDAGNNIDTIAAGGAGAQNFSAAATPAAALTLIETACTAVGGNEDFLSVAEDCLGSAATWAASGYTAATLATYLGNLYTAKDPATFAAAGVKATTIYIPVSAKITAEAEATVTVSPVGTCPVSSGTYTFAIGASGATTTTIEKTVTLSESATAIKSISIVETAPGTITGTLPAGSTLRLKISKNFKFSAVGTIALSYGDVGIVAAPGTDINGDGSVIEFYLVKGTDLSKLVITGLTVTGKSAAADGDVCEITVSGAGTTKTTLPAGTFTEYGYTFTAADKALPVLYAGTWEDNETLKVTFKETVANSWVATRKTTFTFPEGVKVANVEVTKNTNTNIPTGDFDVLSAPLGAGLCDFEIDENKFTISDVTTTNVATKCEVAMIFTLSVDAAFTGDITVTCGGSAVTEDTELLVATAAMPFTVEADINEVNIDYRNVPVGDITIKEAVAGALDDNRTLYIQAENMNFEKGFTWEVTEGDIDIEDVTVANGVIAIEVDTASAKTPSTIVISNLELYLDRTLPTGDYCLSVVEGTIVDAQAQTVIVGALASATNDAFFLTYDNGADDCWFDTDEVVLQEAYVRVITAARDQDDSTFTTQISVPIGAYEISCGTSTIAIDTPAFINEAGYTMMPLRGVVEALSGSAIISWDDATKTITILFGSRVISMTIGTKSMVINGTSIAMSSAPEIVNSRTFLPLRDLGYALGLGDSKIAWDDTTKTATLN